MRGEGEMGRRKENSEKREEKRCHFPFSIHICSQLQGILNQYGCTESEAWGGCVAKFRGEFGKKSDQLAAVALSNQISALKQKYLIIEQRENYYNQKKSKIYFGEEGDEMFSIIKISYDINTRYSQIFNEGLESATANVRLAKTSAWYAATYEDKAEKGLVSFCWVVWVDCIELKKKKMQ